MEGSSEGTRPQPGVGLEGAQKLEECFFFAGFELAEFVRDVFRFASMPENGVE